MNIFRIEKLRIELQENLTAEKSPFVQLILLNSFFLEIINQNNNSLSEAFITEFVPTYLTAIKNISAIGIEPSKINTEFSTVKKITKSEIFLEFHNIINNEVSRIENEIKLVRNSLEGYESEVKQTLLSFPVKINDSNSNFQFGQIETFTVKIDAESSLTEDKFIIVPTFKEVDKQLEDQIKTSWQLAINYLKKYYKKPSKFHEVVLIFAHKFAHFEGFSLGLAITIGFIQALFKHYNTELSLSLNSNVTFTGGFDTNKKVKNLGENIIRQKTETVFYSPYNYFALPDGDAEWAKKELTELNLSFPKKKLKIINIQDFDDLINHRQIITIEKAKLTERTTKFMRNNKVSLLLLLLLSVIISVIALYSYDDNPHGFEVNGNDVNIINKRGRVLWETKQNLRNLVHGESLVHLQKIFDINNDGINEIILSNEIGLNSISHGRIACFDKSGKLLWEYVFRDSIANSIESYNPNQYNSYFVDIVEYNNRKILLGVARHNDDASAVYQLDITNGRRIPGTLWSQGHHNQNAVVGDFNSDGIPELFIGGINNSMESAFTYLIDINKLNGQTPNKLLKLFNNLPIADFKEYILIGKTDISNFASQRFNIVQYANVDIFTGDFVINTLEARIKQPIGLVYRINKNFDKITPQIGDEYLYIRDNLINEGKLNPPFTNDKEYEKMLINGIKEWNGKEFVQFPAQN